MIYCGDLLIFLKTSELLTSLNETGANANIETFQSKCWDGAV